MKITEIELAIRGLNTNRSTIHYGYSRSGFVPKPVERFGRDKFLSDAREELLNFCDTMPEIIVQYSSFIDEMLIELKNISQTTMKIGPTFHSDEAKEKKEEIKEKIQVLRELQDLIQEDSSMQSKLIQVFQEKMKNLESEREKLYVMQSEIKMLKATLTQSEAEVKALEEKAEQQRELMRVVPKSQQFYTLRDELWKIIDDLHDAKTKHNDLSLRYSKILDRAPIIKSNLNEIEKRLAIWKELSEKMVSLDDEESQSFKI